MAEKRTGLCFLGRESDLPYDDARWSKFRPTVAFALHKDPDHPPDGGEPAPFFDTVFLAYKPEDRVMPILDRVLEDIEEVGRRYAEPPRVVPVATQIADVFDPESCFESLLAAVEHAIKESGAPVVYYGMNSGTHAMLLAAYFIAHLRLRPVELLQIKPFPRKDKLANSINALHTVLDVSWTSYTRIADHLRRINQQYQDTPIYQTRNKALRSRVERWTTIAARTRDPLLLLGETGTGKTTLAREIHQRCIATQGFKGNFVAVNCATLDPELANSSLFGHKKSAFTGALSDREGYLKNADGGTLFLDEIGALPASTQAKLLNAIASQGRGDAAKRYRFIPLGSDQEVEADFRLICATNEDLPAAVAEGRFRHDLYARIRRWEFPLPNLRDRIDELDTLIDESLLQWNTNQERANDRDVGVRFAAAARKAYIRYATDPHTRWAGNFRELHDSIARMATMAWIDPAANRQITEGIVEEEIAEMNRRRNGPGPSGIHLADQLLRSLEAEASPVPLYVRVEDVFQRLCLDQANGNRAEAGRRLYGRGQQNPSNIFSSREKSVQSEIEKAREQDPHETDD